MKFNKLILNSLTAVSPTDGRYSRITKPLMGYFSEFALIYHRWCMEINYLLALNDYQKQHGIIKMPTFTEKQHEFLLFSTDEKNFAIELAQAIKDVEKTTNHDVKSVEYILKGILEEQGFSKQHLAHVHFGLTSEDVNNLSYARMLMTSLEDIFIPVLDEIYNDLLTLAHDNASNFMIARTHGQAATPTSFGKEMKIYAERLKEQITQLDNYKTRVKINGPSGNFNGLIKAYPQINWPQFAFDFVRKYYNSGKENGRYVINSFTNQIEDHDTFSELFAIFMRIGVILSNFSQDIWLYISSDALKQKTKEGEVGSSAMPHKVNPINFENAWGNLGVANALFGHFSEKLPNSRLQRDLSDSTVIRYFGVAFGSALTAYDNIRTGIKKIEVNEKKMLEELQNHAEVVSEAYQLILKREGHEDAYELLKDFTRGKKMTLEILHQFVDTLEVSDEIKNELKAITPENYTGLSERLSTASNDSMIDKYKHLKD